MNNTDIIIFSGQSNMQGQSEALPKENFPVDGAVEYRYYGDELIPLKHPVGECLDDNGNIVLGLLIIYRDADITRDIVD